MKTVRNKTQTTVPIATARACPIAHNESAKSSAKHQEELQTNQRILWHVTQSVRLTLWCPCDPEQSTTLSGFSANWPLPRSYSNGGDEQAKAALVFH